MPINRLQLAVLIGAALIGVLIFFLPHQSSEVQTSVAAVGSDENRMIDSAVALVNGADPMAGIMLLREVLKENPENSRAQFQMGVFSMRSQQYSKAVERFSKVLEIDPDAHEAMLLLGHAHANSGNREEAIKNFETYKTHLSAPAEIAEIDGYINELKNN